MSALSHLPEAEAELLADRTLLVRTDTKFVLHSRELPVLTGLLKSEHYAAARHPGGDFFAYENRYFDTTDRPINTSFVSRSRNLSKRIEQ